MNEEANDNENNDAEDNTVQNEEEASNDTAYDKVIVDEDDLNVTLNDIEKVTDSDFDQDHYLVNLDIENNTDDTIEVQTREFSADGKMIDDMIMFSETISAGKTSEGSIEIIDYDKDELPDIKEDMEFILVVLDEETYETKDEYNVTIDLK